MSKFNSRLEKAMLESRIMMAETQLNMGIKIHASRHIIELSIEDFDSQEKREFAFVRLSALAQANNYSISQSVNNSKWIIQIKALAIRADQTTGSNPVTNTDSSQQNTELKIYNSMSFWGGLSFLILFIMSWVTYIFIEAALDASLKNPELPAWLFVGAMDLLGLLSLEMMFDRRPKIIINLEGIHMPRWQCKFIPWEDIESVGYSFHFGRYNSGIKIELRLNEPSIYKDRLWKFNWGRFAQTGDAKKPIIIDLTAYDSDAKSLWRFINSLQIAKEQVTRGRAWSDKTLDPIMYG